MSTVRDFHNQAMELAQRALIARAQEQLEEAENLAREAYKLETQAAELVPYGSESEPTRSILYRSAASLAYQCHEYEASQRLIAKGLSGYPPPQIERELKDLFEQVNFETHLNVRGIVLEEADFQLALQGPEVGSGIILYKEFKKRIENLDKILVRTMERLSGSGYRKGGSASKRIVPFSPALSAPRPGSFAVTIRLTYEENQQMQIPLFFTAEKVIDEVMTAIEHLNNEQNDDLREQMGTSQYYANFVSMARDIAPDGERIRFVGFTTRDRSIAMTLNRNAIELPLDQEVADEPAERKPIQVTGQLDYASARDSDDEQMGITTNDNKQYYLLISEGFDDLLHSYWRQRVVVKGTVSDNHIFLEDISSAED